MDCLVSVPLRHTPSYPSPIEPPTPPNPYSPLPHPLQAQPPPYLSSTTTGMWEWGQPLPPSNSLSPATPISPAGLESAEQQQPQASSKPQASSMSKERAHPHSPTVSPSRTVASLCPAVFAQGQQDQEAR